MTRKQPLTSEAFKEIYSQVPRLCVEVVVIEHERVLLTKRNHASWSNQWHIPGGTVLFGELIEASVTRIAQEELGIKVKITDLLGYIEYPSEEKERGFGWSVGIAFLCRTRDPIATPNMESEEVRLFKELPTEMITEQKTFLTRVLPEVIS